MPRLSVTSFVLVNLLLVTRPATPADILLPRLTVRSYPATFIRPSDWQTAQHEATELMELAGIEIEWVDCGSSGHRPVRGRCGVPLKRDEVAVRLIRLHSVPSAGPFPLGESLIDPQQHAGTLATIYVDRVEWLAQAGRTDAGTLLGRAIAHELGHLVLGTRDHGTGLMRPLWTGAELRHARRVDWQFAPADAARMQAALSRRMPVDNIAWATESRRGGGADLTQSRGVAETRRVDDLGMAFRSIQGKHKSLRCSAHSALRRV
jgi:hypothetical protein